MVNDSLTRKLATIVALDVAGYSARTEADEARTTAEVAALRKVIDGIAAEHGGRIFNTAGDGFMLEFGSSLSAVEAALKLAAACEPRVRVGVHLGDVVAQPNGDLLGHGVNVAARLMAMSDPGGALVSADVRRTIRGPLAERLQSRGLLKLDKMAEAVEAFALKDVSATPTAPDVFLAYAREDQVAAEMFAAAFERAGLSVWWDATLRSGEAYDETMERALKAAKAVVVLWSRKSVDSRWVRSEATLADRNKSLVPCMIEHCERPIMFELTQTAELSHWQGEQGDRAWVTFLEDVRQTIAAREKALAKAAPPSFAAATATDVPAVELRGTKPSLAIMPFANRSGEHDDDVFADGMVEDLISALSLGRSAKVIAASATRAFRNQAADLRLIGRELGARYILEGNVRRIGPNLRVTAQVVEAESGRILWTERFDRPLSELALLQEELITDVAAQIGAQVNRLEMDRALKKPSDLTAWEAVMRSFSAYGKLGPATLPTAVAAARRATELAPDWGVAHGCLALALGSAYLFSYSVDEAVKQEARAHAARALALGGHDHNVLWTVAWALSCVGPMEEALRNGAQAIEANPNNANARNAYAQALLCASRPEEALTQLDEADRLAPRGFNYNISLSNRAIAHWQAGRFDEAMEYCERSLQIHPANAGGLQNKMCLLAKAGRIPEGIAVLKTLISYYPYTTRSLLTEALLRNPVVGNIAVEIGALTAQVWDAMAKEDATP